MFSDEQVEAAVRALSDPERFADAIADGEHLALEDLLTQAQGSKPADWAAVVDAEISSYRRAVQA